MIKKLKRMGAAVVAVLMLVSLLPLSVLADDAVATNEIDFSAKRIIVATQNAELLAEDSEALVSNYKNIYILQFETEEDTQAAYDKYAQTADFVEVDKGISIAEGEAAETVTTDTVMTAEENPLSEIEAVLGITEENAYDIALIDTGADDVANAVSVIGNDAWDDNGHGNSMAAYIYEQNPDARILSIKALDANGVGDVSAIYAAIQVAIENKVSVINLSLSALGSADSAVIEAAINEAVSNGIVVVGAAGNNGNDAAYYIPGGIDAAMIIGAAGASGEKIASSNYGATVDYNVVADSTSEAAAKMSGFISKNGTEEIANVLNNGLIYATDYQAGNQSVNAKVLWGKGTVEEVADHVFSIIPEEGYRIWRTAGLNQYLDYFQPQVNEEGNYVLDSQADTLRVYFISDDEYAEILEDAGAEENLKYYWDNPKWFFKFGKRNLNDSEFQEVYGEYFAAQAKKAEAMDSEQFEAAYAPAGTNYLGQMLNYAPSVGATFTGSSPSNPQNNRQEGVDDTWNDYTFNITSGFASGKTIHMNCNMNGGWFPSEGGTVTFHVDWVNTTAHTFGGDCYYDGWATGGSAEQQCKGKYEASYKPPEGYLTLKKSSADTSITDGNRCYSLAGAEYTVYSNSACTTSVGKLTTKADGSTNTLTLNAGTYYIKETKASPGYMLSTRTITATVQSEKTFTATDAENPGNDPEALEITKISNTEYATQYPLTGAEFTIKYYDNTTGDVSGTPLRTWIIQTIERNGTYRAYLNSTCLKEGSDELYVSNGVPVIPVGTVSIEETKPAQGYTLTDAVLKDNDGNEMLLDDGKFIGIISMENGLAKLNYGNYYTMLNTPIEVHTMAINKANSTHYATAGEPVTIVDTVTMNGTDAERLINESGDWVNIKYRLVGEIHVLGSDELLASATKNFITDDFDGHQENLEFVISDTSALEGKTIYVSEKLYTVQTKQIDGQKQEFEELVACEDETVFPDIDVDLKETQRIHFPKIGTTLTGEEGEKEVVAQTELTLVDTVKYESLIPGHEYTVKGVLMDKETEEALLDDDGNEITAETTFTAEDIEGEVEVTFTFPAVTVQGKSVVAFESLEEDGKELCVHKDIEDEDQTVPVKPTEIGTTFVNPDAEEGEEHQIYVGKQITLVDTVEYKNAAVGAEYQVTGTLMDKETGKELLNKDGEPYTATATLVPEEADGTIELTFVIDAEDIYGGKTLVAFEELTYKNELITDHKDLEDEGQTVEVLPPEIKTTLLDDATQGHVANAFQKLSLTDTVEYKGLVKGREYEMVGTLMSKKTGKPAKDKNGKEITAKTTFTAEDTEGVVELVFKFENRDLMGDTLVAFEDLFEAGTQIGDHEDIDDDNQSVRLPYIGTTLTLNDTSKKFNPIAGLKLNDAVDLNNLDLDTTYMIKGYLVNQSSGKYLKADGTETEKKEEALCTQVKFLATKHDALLNVEFTLDATSIDFDIVCYEELYALTTDEEGNEKEVLVAEHSDINDDAQTVHYEPMPKTGDNNSFLPWILMMIVGLAGVVTALTLRLRTKRNN